MRFLTQLGNFYRLGPGTGCTLGKPYTYIVMLFMCTTKPGYYKITITSIYKGRRMTLSKWAFITKKQNRAPPESSCLWEGRQFESSLSGVYNITL